jgi:hypothetical protein
MCPRCDWEGLLRSIEEMLADDRRYGWAYNTLTGIFDWIFRNSHATEAQFRAVYNIKNSKRK